MTKQNPGSGISGSFLEYKFLYCLAVLFYNKYVLFLHSGEKNNKGESIKKSNAFKYHLIYSIYSPKLQAKN